VGAGTYELNWDYESRLVEVKKNGAVVASVVYDGNRVKAAVGLVTTAYVGAYYEKQGSGVTKYYYAGEVRMALRRSGYATGNGLFWLLGDHLGSTSVTVASSGSKVAELRYKAWGETRYQSGTTPTSYRFRRHQTSGVWETPDVFVWLDRLAEVVAELAAA
jgi:hypothetical protein